MTDFDIEFRQERADDIRENLRRLAPVLEKKAQELEILAPEIYKAIDLMDSADTDVVLALTALLGAFWTEIAIEMDGSGPEIHVHIHLGREKHE